MRVLFLCYRGNPFCGGQGIYLYNLSRELAKLGVEIDVLVGPPYPDPMDEWAKVVPVENLNLWMINTNHIPREKLWRIFSPWNFIDYALTRFHFFTEMETFSFRAFGALRKLLKTRRYDLIHDIQGLGWGLLPMKGFGIPIITTVHHPLTQDRDADFLIDRTFWHFLTTLLFYPLAMQRFVINRLDRVITSSREGKKEIQRAFGVRADSISVVYNGLDVQLFRPLRKRREKNALLFVGNTEDHKKGMRYLFEALALLPADITLTIVDEGPPKRLTAFGMIKQLGLERRVRFTGKIDSETLIGLYNTKTLLVMASLYEGFGLPAAEAMACGMPVVATDAGAMREVAGEDGAAILVPPKDPRALSRAILTVLKDKAMQSAMSTKGIDRAVKNFAWPVAAANTLSVYTEVINQYRSSL